MPRQKNRFCVLYEWKITQQEDYFKNTKNLCWVDVEIVHEDLNDYINFLISARNSSVWMIAD